MAGYFDHIAADYDRTFTHTVTGTAQRERVWDYLESALLISRAPLNVLELNCGTGEDAVWFAKKGCRVRATDASGNMVTEAETKILRHGVSDRVQARLMRATEISHLPSGDRFDLIFSNFGGLNCLSSTDLKHVCTSLPSRLNPGGRFIAVIMPAFCLWETTYFSAKLNFRAAVRRRKGSVSVSSPPHDLRIWYYSPGSFAHLCAAKFRTKAILPIGFFLPPSYLDPFFSGRKKVISFLAKAEGRIPRISFFASLSDHYLIDLELRP